MTKELGLEGDRPGLVEKRNSQANLKVMIWGSFTRDDVGTMTSVDGSINAAK